MVNVRDIENRKVRATREMFGVGSPSCVAIPISGVQFTQPQGKRCRPAMDAIEWTHRNAARIGDPRRIYLSGSSAGAYLCAVALAHDWTKRGLPPDFITGATLLTGVYDLEPLLHISVNELVRLAPDRVHDNSPIHHPPRLKVPLLMQVGGAEPPGWRAQTLEFAEVCRAAGCSVEVIVLPGETHFSILRSLAHNDHPLTRKMISAMR